MSDFSCVAFIPVFNEADILPHVLRHLWNQGIGTYIIDNWSTDGPWVAGWPNDSSLYSGSERFPSSPVRTYNWRDILTRVEQLSRESKADWCMLHDADEIRRSRRDGWTCEHCGRVYFEWWSACPRCLDNQEVFRVFAKSETLLQTLERFDRDGATAANFEVFNFWPIDESWDGTQDPEKHFQYYDQGGVDRYLPHVKAWKNNFTGWHPPLSLADTGGHMARQVLPHHESLILKHYPIRSIAQATRKLDQDRFPRWNPEERKMQWHVQYDELVKSREFIKDPKTLKRWKGV